MNGYHWCVEIRKVSSVPVIFISSASDNMNIIMAMNMGGDEFIAKPFDFEVLIAKVQALLRRTYDYAASAPVLEHRGVLLDRVSHNVRRVLPDHKRKRRFAGRLKNQGPRKRCFRGS